MKSVLIVARLESSNNSHDDKAETKAGTGSTSGGGLGSTGRDRDGSRGSDGNQGSGSSRDGNGGSRGRASRSGGGSDRRKRNDVGSSGSDAGGDGLNSAGDGRVLGSVRLAESLESSKSLSDGVVVLAVGVQAGVGLLDEVLVGAVAGAVLVVLALLNNVEPGVDTLGNNVRASGLGRRSRGSRGRLSANGADSGADGNGLGDKLGAVSRAVGHGGRAVSDGGSAGGDGDLLGLVDGGLGAVGEGGSQAGEKGNGNSGETHFECV